MNSNINFNERDGRIYIPLEVGFYQDIGIRVHNPLTAIFVKLFGSGIIECKDHEGKTFLCNRNSLKSWVKVSSLQCVTIPELFKITRMLEEKEEVSDEEIKEHFYNIINMTTKA